MKRLVSQNTRVTRTPHGVVERSRQDPPFSTDRGGAPPTRATDRRAGMVPTRARTNPTADGTWAGSRCGPALSFRLRGPGDTDRPPETGDVELGRSRTAYGNGLRSARGFRRCARTSAGTRPAAFDR